MYLIRIEARCADQVSEVLLDELEYAELLVEDLVSQLLLELFEAVDIDEVTIKAHTLPQRGQPYCSIRIQATCSNASVLDTAALERKELVLEERISYALMELFGTVDIDRVSIMVPAIWTGG